MQEAVLLSDLCEKVYVLQNLSFLTGEKKLAEILDEKPSDAAALNLRAAVEAGEISGSRYQSYLRMWDELKDLKEWNFRN